MHLQCHKPGVKVKIAWCMKSFFNLHLQLTKTLCWFDANTDCQCVFMCLCPWNYTVKSLKGLLDQQFKMCVSENRAVLRGHLIAAVKMFCTSCGFLRVLISHLPSAGLCAESGSLLCLLCLRWCWSSTPAIRQSCRDSSYASGGEQL